MVLPPRHGLSLCAGGGGLDLGLELAEPGFTTAAYVEWEEYPRECLIAAQRAGYLAPAPIWDNVKSFDGRAWRGVVDTVLAGYPCQPFSQAGHRKGADDPRHLWPDIARIIDQVQPRWVLLENVAGHVTLGAETVLRRLHDMGYATATGLFSASETGAPHERLRWFTVAHTDGRDTSTERQQCSGQQRLQLRARGAGGTDVGNASHHHDARGLDQKADRGAASRGESADNRIGQTPHRQRIRAKFGSTVNNVGDAQGANRRGQQQAQGSLRGRAGSARDDGKLADTCSARPQGRERPGTSDQRDRSQAHGPDAQFRRAWLYPPGPNDADGWADIIANAPDLAPSVSISDVKRAADHFAQMVACGELAQTQAESAVCRLADGMAARSRILKLLGNGVCPLAAANAWRSLSHAHGLRPVDLDAPETNRNSNTGGSV